MAGIDRWLHYTVTTIDRFHCIIVFLCAVKNLLSTYVCTYLKGDTNQYFLSEVLTIRVGLCT